MPTQHSNSCLRPHYKKWARAHTHTYLSNTKKLLFLESHYEI